MTRLFGGLVAFTHRRNDMPDCLLGIGSNLGDRRATMDWAVAQLAALPQVQLTAVSRWHETGPIGGPAEQGPFLNGAITVETTLAPRALLSRLHEIEKNAGRWRKLRWEARTLDLDLLLYGQTECDDPCIPLTLPHPRLAMRRFVLEPAAEIAPGMVDPITGQTMAQLQKHLNTAPGYIAVTGPRAVDRTALARALAETLEGRLVLGRAPSVAGDEAQSLWELEASLHQQATLLDRGKWLETASVRRSGGPPAVSDFWVGELASLAHQILSPQRRVEFAAQWQAALPGIVVPLLLVAIDAERVPHGVGPTLRCQSATWDGITEEVRAAVAGMR